MLGIIVGDGYVSKYYVCISDMYYENLVLVKKVLIELGYKAVITRDRNENRYRLWINSVKFVNMLKRLGYKSNKKVPRTIKEYHTYSKCFILEDYMMQKVILNFGSPEGLYV